MTSESRDSQNFAKRIREHALTMTSIAGASHIGSALSMADIVTSLYSNVMKIDPKNPLLADRDRLILSKGHACSILYAALAEKGFFPVSELQKFGKYASNYMTHVSHKVPGVESSTGSLGHGVPFATGKALGLKIAKNQGRVFVIVGDGELDEGSNWEAMLFAAHNQLTNLTIIVDANNLQSLTTVDETLRLEPLRDKAESFGWRVSEIDGHDLGLLNDALGSADQIKPHFIIARTVKGKGVSFMENKVEWHYKSLSTDELDSALLEIRSTT